MCGIFAIFNDSKSQAGQTVLTGLKALEYRGYDSWGLAVLQNGKLKYEKHVGKIGQAETKYPQGHIALGHTRWATHGGVTITNAHPHFDCRGRIAVVHNGMVENYNQLKAGLEKQGHNFTSQSDTEVIAHLIEEQLKHKPDFVTATLESFIKLQGSNAIVVFDTQSKQLIGCRDGSPLLLGINGKEQFLASDQNALAGKAKEVVYLDDGEAVVISENEVVYFKVADKKPIQKKKQANHLGNQKIAKEGYRHFFIKEVNEQATILPKIAKSEGKTYQLAAQQIKKADQVLLTGCGTAYHCALLGEYLLAKQGAFGRAYMAHECRSFLDFTTEKSVIIAFSQSGETADVLLAIKAAKKKGAKVIALVNAQGSTLQRLADLTIPVAAGPEIAVVSTKAFTSQLAHMVRITQYLNGKFQLSDFSKISSFLQAKQMNQLQSLAKKLAKNHHIFVIGKDLNYPAALEFALKIKETSYIHAEAFAAGELKHGVISLIEKGTPIFVLANFDQYFSEICSSAAQVKARGGQVIGVGPKNSVEFDTWIQTPDLGELSVFGNIMVGQLLGYYLGLERGADPDKPRNLAKSVTVK
ncbi:glutamine--fructose-6-phosphate transaminase (isomerizing) [Candidatus Beckwithbacteria bacterium]|nr:glutamine--fructose-6-phosphate transaminase (isomerizing) [Candidatus Beckwithbacteria bacterium]